MSTGTTHSRTLGLLKPALALVAVVLALLLAEGVVRALGRVPDVKPIHVTDERFAYQRSANPILSFELRPNYRNDAPDLFQTFERTNAHGQRDLERALDKPAGTRRVLLLGDSVVEGSGVEEAQTISRRLEALYADGTTEVLNFGVSGYCTRAAVELLETKGLAFAPDVVVLLFVENDFNNFNAEAFQLAAGVERPAWAKELFLRSEAFRLAALQFNLYGFGAEQDPMRWNNRAIGDNNVVEGLRRLRALAERDGFRPLIAIWPRFEDDRIVDLPTMPEDPQSLVIERLAAVVGIPAVRLSEHFKRLVADAGRPLNPRLEFTIGDRMHPSTRGCRAAAEGLLHALAVPAFASGPAAAVLRPVVEDPAAVEVALALSSRGAPDYARVFTRLGNVEQGAGNIPAAIELYNQALGEDPDSADAHVNLGHALARTGRPDEALAHYAAALAANPDAPGARVAQARLLEQLGRVDEALAGYQAQLARNPEDPEAHLRLGNLRIKQGRPAEAIPHYERSHRAAPEVAETLNNLGLAYEQVGHLAEAAANYEAALVRDPSLVDTYNNLGIVLARQGDPNAAALAFGAALRADPAHAGARGNLCAVLEQLGRLREADQQYREGIRIANERGDAETARRFETRLGLLTAPKSD